MKTFKLSSDFKQKALQWAAQFSHCTYFNHNNITQQQPYNGFREFIAAGAKTIIPFSGIDDLETLKQHHKKKTTWLIGHINYELKDQLENLTSKREGFTDFPLISFYQPLHLLFYEKDQVIIESSEADAIYKEILSVQVKSPTSWQNHTLTQSSAFSAEAPKGALRITPDTTKEEYLQTVCNLQQHILEGDIYEINYCIRYAIKNALINPLTLYSQLNTASPTPFSCFYKTNEHYLLCASPERFLKKTGQKLISQPIKGTARRGKSEAEEMLIKQQLANSEKERAENMMIVDLVRNDLARSCQPGSVKVEEMFGIYTFRHLHHMISTISGTLCEEVHFIDALRHAFPMGSMTGAPKTKVMQLTEQYEKSKRELYAGTVGYITPDGDFDFNVVIRSLLYNANNHNLSFQVGSAITYDAIAEEEYEECLLKAEGILKTLGVSTI